MELSFIIVTYQREDLLQACIDSIYAQKNLPAATELIVVDNDGHAEVEARHDGIALQLIRTGENLGPAGGRNIGMDVAKGDLWILLDDDALFRDDNMVTRILDIFKANPNCGIVAGVSYSPTGEVEVKHLPFPNKTYALSIRETCPAPYFIGYVHGLRATVIREVGGYPARYFYAMEELDLSMRVQIAGYDILFNPDVQVTHYHSPKGRPIVGDLFWYQNALNKIQVAWRFYPPFYIFSTSAIWMLRSLWKTRNPKLVWRIWKAYQELLPNLREERHVLDTKTLRKIRAAGGRFLY